jgi:anti-anti-sigma factor
MTLDLTCLDGVAVIRIGGEIDHWEVPAARDRLRDCLGLAGWRALVDLSAARWRSSMMIGLLLATHRRAAAAGGAVVFTGLAPTVRRILEMLGADRVLRSAPSVSEGVAALNGNSLAPAADGRQSS